MSLKVSAVPSPSPLPKGEGESELTLEALVFSLSPLGEGWGGNKRQGNWLKIINLMTLGWGFGLPLGRGGPKTSTQKFCLFSRLFCSLPFWGGLGCNVIKVKPSPLT